jgi:hypothetical protein
MSTQATVTSPEIPAAYSRSAPATSSRDQREAAGTREARFPGIADVRETMSRNGWRSRAYRRICGTRPTVEIVIASPRIRPPQGWERSRAARITSS